MCCRENGPADHSAASALPSAQLDEGREAIGINHRWNFFFNVTSASFDSFGGGFVAVGTVLAAFLTVFTKSNTVIGLLPAILMLMWTAPQVLSSLYTGHLPRKKKAPLLVRMGFVLPWLILAVLTRFVLKPGAMTSLVVFFVLYGVFALCGGLSKPVWVSLINKLILPNRRGRFFSIRLVVGTSFAIGASLIVREVLRRYSYPVNFAVLFFLAFCMFALSSVLVALSREPAVATGMERRSHRRYLSELGSTLRRDKSFRWYIVATSARSFGAVSMAAAFYTVYAIRQLGVGLDQVGVFLSIMLVSQLVGGMALGHIADTRGPRDAELLGRAFGILSAGAILLTHDITGVYAAYALLGVASASGMISYIAMLMELAPPDKADMYLGLSGLLRAPSVIAAPLIGGFLADRFSYNAVFGAALAGAALSGMILVLKVKPPARAGKEGVGK